MTSPIVAALEDAWQEIRANHPDLPVRVAFAVGEGGHKWGHFAPGRWVSDEERIHEILVSGERMKYGAEGVLDTILHEATHTLAHARQIQDTSRGGRYHNAKFAGLARDLTLKVSQAPKIGWSVTEITDATRERYAGTLTALDEALRVHRAAELVAEKSPRKSSNNGKALACQCDPPRKLRASNKVVDEGAILCGVCGESFEEVEV